MNPILAALTCAAMTWAMTTSAGWLRCRRTSWTRYFAAADPLAEFTPDPGEATPLYDALIREWPLIDACTVIVNQSTAALPDEVEAWLRGTS